MHGVNRWVDRKVIDPVINVWMWFPELFRDRFSDFSKNLKAPRNMINNLFQGDVISAGAETMRFALNTTIGIGGLFDVAKPLTGVKADPEDFGQTLAVWGLPAGPLLEMPIRGPRTLRDLAGGVVDGAFSITTYFAGPLEIGVRTMRYGNRAERRARLDEVLDETYEQDFEASYHGAQCEYYKQRVYRILDGDLKLPKQSEEDREPAPEEIPEPPIAD
jgi:phospholipid-binding lipoprotein MlaA